MSGPGPSGSAQPATSPSHDHGPRNVARSASENSCSYSTPDAS